MPTGIEWTDETWNPVTGCTQVSPGCANCYIQRSPPFRKEGRSFTYEGKRAGVTTGVRLHEDRLSQPLLWKRPRRIFTCSLGDLFHPDVPDEFICRVFETMRDAPQHVFQVLTKRPERMKEWFRAWRWRRLPCCSPGYPRDPLPNVWLGVSAENQHWADRRIPPLLETPAAVRFVSAEPLLGPLNLIPYMDRGYESGGPQGWIDLPSLDWTIVGGESGPNARPMHPDWVRGVRDQCDQAKTAFFFKQWGEWAPAYEVDALNLQEAGWLGTDRERLLEVPCQQGIPEMVYRFGKHRAGALLDGREYREFPGVNHV